MKYNTKIYSFLSKLYDYQIQLESKLSQLSFEGERDITIQKKLSKNREVLVYFKEYEKCINHLKECNDSIELERDEEMKSLFLEEKTTLEAQIQTLELKIKKELCPSEEYKGKNIILEIRAAAGGEESSIFVMNLFDMYKRYAQNKNWTLKVVEMRESAQGFSFITFTLSGKNIYSRMKFESGVHRVQRVPDTESRGRVHTSTTTVSVIPEPDEVEIQLDCKDLRIDVYRASGAGGQHVNKTESAVRVVHLPTNITVSCQQERSQILNKEIALKILRAKLWERENQLQKQEFISTLKEQVGKGERSEKIRTYNYPQNRMTDHRISLTINNLDEIMEGALDEIHEALREKEEEAFFENLLDTLESAE